MQQFPLLCILLIEEFGNCKLLSSIDLHLLPVHVCVESNLLLTCLQLYQSWDTVNNPERVGRRQLQLPSTVRSLLSYVDWVVHHAEQEIRNRNPPTPLSAMISKPLSRVQLYEESKHTRIQSFKISSVNLSICQSVNLSGFGIPIHVIELRLFHYPGFEVCFPTNQYG